MKHFHKNTDPYYCMLMVIFFKQNFRLSPKAILKYYFNLILIGKSAQL